MVKVQPFLLSEDPFVGFSDNIPLFVEQIQPDGKTIYITAPNKISHFNVQKFPKLKRPGTYRIFCMGGSTTYGHPYNDATSFCGWLREFLHSADTSHDWEVINAGGISYASYRVANLMLELSRYQPDLFIVYSGHNEFLEERTYRNVKATPKWVIKIKKVLGMTRTYTAVNRLVELIPWKPVASSNKKYKMDWEVEEILNKTIGPTSYHRNDVLQQQIIEHYKLNLRRMINITRSIGSRIIFSTLPSNLKDISPFKSENSANLSESAKKQWVSLYELGKKFQETGSLNKAVEAYTNALSIDNRHADLNFRTGQVLFLLKRYDEARKAFLKAKDEDICPLRILTPMLDTLHEIAKEENVSLLDFEKIIEDSCNSSYGHKIPGREFFLDHVHPTIENNRKLAIALLDIMVKEGIFIPSASWGEKSIAAVAKKVESQIDEKKQAVALRFLGKVFDWAGKLEEAHSLFSQALPLLKNDDIFLIEFAYLSLRRGETEKALEYMDKAVKINPVNLLARDEMISNLLRDRGKFNEVKRDQ